MTANVTPPARPGLLTENGEPLRSPFEAQEIVITRQPSVGETGGLVPVQLAFERLAAILERQRVPDEPVAPAPTDEQAERRAHLEYLHRWVASTANIEAIVEALTKAIERHQEDPKKHKIPPELTKRLATQTESLKLARERDAIQAERDGLYPGDKCLGLGGTDEVMLVIRAAPEEGQPSYMAKVVYAESDGPKTWSNICTVCPEGVAAQAAYEVARAAMVRRYQAAAMEAMVGRAALPADFDGFDLDNDPDRVLAEACRRWYVGNVDGPRDPTKVPKRWLLLHGPNRRGKSTLAAGICKLAHSRGEEAYFRSMKKVLDALRATFDPNNPACHAELLQALYDAPLLVLDDLGAEHLTGWVEETIAGLLDERLKEKKMTVITSNLGWTEYTTDAARGEALVKREAPVLSLKDWDPEELIRRVGERAWWRIRAAANQVAVLGPVRGIRSPTGELPKLDPKDKLEEWTG